MCYNRGDIFYFRSRGYYCGANIKILWTVVKLNISGPQKGSVKIDFYALSDMLYTEIIRERLSKIGMGLLID